MPIPRNVSQAISQKIPRAALHLDSYLCPKSAKEEKQLASSYPPANITSITFVPASSPNVTALHNCFVEASNLQSINMASQRGILPIPGTIPTIRTLKVNPSSWKFNKR
ncbi:hypothetical protein IFR05_005737 [Cadophora sp. M221]|nr:hypothetical protein IFR05_005737 [Cadophora sp. M221]